MRVTCPEGHEVEITDPTTESQLVGVNEQGEQQFAPIQHDAIHVRCTEEVVRSNDDGTKFRDVCGAEFITEAQ